jgi:NAD(P)-dependent dehydrogenase (short-subunit alcohol dehydrogenase family)
VVTGAAGGIGRAVALSLFEAGVDVALLDRDAEGCAALAGQIGDLGGRAVAMGCDIADPGSVRAAAEAVGAVFPAIDILINNAGILRPAALAEVSLAEWNTLLAVNLTGYLLTAQAFRPALLAAGGGAMVPLRRIAGPQDMADAVLFLASARASYVNGAEILVDGGLDQVLMGLTPRPGY